jgi:hypothetical protein
MLNKWFFIMQKDLNTLGSSSPQKIQLKMLHEFCNFFLSIVSFQVKSHIILRHRHIHVSGIGLPFTLCFYSVINGRRLITFSLNYMFSQNKRIGYLNSWLKCKLSIKKLSLVDHRPMFSQVGVTFQIQQLGEILFAVLEQLQVRQHRLQWQPPSTKLSCSRTCFCVFQFIWSSYSIYIWLYAQVLLVKETFVS